MPVRFDAVAESSSQLVMVRRKQRRNAQINLFRAADVPTKGLLRTLKVMRITRGVSTRERHAKSKILAPEDARNPSTAVSFIF